ncbi:MAG: RibD family protein [Cytophagales bacterium]|nr:RibD family protein [Cytophagales bacterium]
MKIWDALLSIKEQFTNAAQFPATISIYLRQDVEVSFEYNEGADLYLEFDVEKITQNHPFAGGFQQLRIRDEMGLSPEEQHCLTLYFPYTTLPFFGSKQGKCFSISHFAQTLDGRIASCTGDSKWIGNEENLIHAHRMRALCDGILVGANTVVTDNPRLNVRKVNGADPIKVIIGDAPEFSEEQYHAIGPETLIYKNQAVLNGSSSSEEINLQDVLIELSKTGIYSVYIEGGSFTTSSFIQQRQLDQVQLHFAPKVLGAGVSSFSFDGVNQVEDAITFSESKFVPMGDEIMFVGNLTYES